MANITLYELPGCPYCAKVIDKLDELGSSYSVMFAMWEVARPT